MNCRRKLQLIINADDFGASVDTVAATIEGFQQGWLSSATLMASGDAAEAAFEFARNHSEFSFGVHLTLGGDGWEKCVSDPAQIPTLARPDGVFYPSNSIRWAALRHQLGPAQVERELRNQLDRVKNAGISITHVDSHGHLHKFGSILRVLQRLLPDFGIRRVRTVQNVYLRKPLLSPTFWMGCWWKRRICANYVTTKHLFLPSSAGDRHWTEQLLSHCSRNGSMEIGVHPGFDEPWRRDEAQETSCFVERARNAGHQLISWRDL
jgi:predicted glycoside hydrolase/deacetylase ChbG (UPF0249 family)